MGTKAGMERFGSVCGSNPHRWRGWRWSGYFGMNIRHCGVCWAIELEDGEVVTGGN